MIGSFLNVVIYRLPIMLKCEWKNDCIEFLSELSDSNEDKDVKNCSNNPQEEKTEIFNLSVPRSRCPSCGHQITALENIPVISWLFLKGKCSACHHPISIRYPLVELCTALFSVLVAYTYGIQWFTLAALILTWSMIALAIIDFDTQLLPDDITLPIMWLGVLMSLLSISSITLESSVIGLMIGYGSLWSIYQLFKILTGKEGMGFGDFKLLALLGAWLGWQSLPLILLLSALVGSIVGISLILLLGRDKNIPIPFGPYLASAGFISLIWGEQIKHTYLNMMLS
ncbi:MAG: A24 family peptidase [gamma proteobacterium symbiont of Taylorina sp.]|nr:A24 family peptidase [gamma proteobacterium symbiont of Taylorina sp.]